MMSRHRETTTNGVWVVIVAAGSGSRYGAAKQFMDLGGRRVIDWAVDEASRHAEGVVVVVPPNPVPEDHDPTVDSSTQLRVVSGGASRSESVRRGLALVPDTADIVLVHDGARPLASSEIYQAVISAVRDGADGAVPAVPVTDTMRWRGGGSVDRAGLVSVQTPQGFGADLLRRAHASDAEATDDATLVETAGGTVEVVDGDRRNLKITTPHDLTVAAALISDGRAGQ